MLRCTVAHAPPYIPHSCVGMSRNDVECWHAALRGWSRGVMGGGLSISSTHAFNLIDGLSRRRARTAHAHARTEGRGISATTDPRAARARKTHRSSTLLRFIQFYVCPVARDCRDCRVRRRPKARRERSGYRVRRSSAPQPLTLYTFPLLYGLKINIESSPSLGIGTEITHTHTHNETEVAGRESGPGAS